jgi:hypothetical protein
MAFFDLTHRRRVYYKFLFAASCFFFFWIYFISFNFLSSQHPALSHLATCEFIINSAFAQPLGLSMRLERSLTAPDCSANKN